MEFRVELRDGELGPASLNGEEGAAKAFGQVRIGRLGRICRMGSVIVYAGTGFSPLLARCSRRRLASAWQARGEEKTEIIFWRAFTQGSLLRRQPWAFFLSPFQGL